MNSGGCWKTLAGKSLYIHILSSFRTRVNATYHAKVEESSSSYTIASYFLSLLFIVFSLALSSLIRNTRFALSSEYLTHWTVDTHGLALVPLSQPRSSACIPTFTFGNCFFFLLFRLLLSISSFFQPFARMMARSVALVTFGTSLLCLYLSSFPLPFLSLFQVQLPCTLSALAIRPMLPHSY